MVVFGLVSMSTGVFLSCFQIEAMQEKNGIEVCAAAIFLGGCFLVGAALSLA